MPATELTIVAYHFVRDPGRGGFPRLKAIDIAGFRGQLDHIERTYAVIDTATLIAAVKTGDYALLPPHPAYLTFDDGLAEHRDSVVPLLLERRLHGAFFAPAQAVSGRVVADVHRIQFILAAVDDPARLCKRILAEVAAARREFDLDEAHVYLARYHKPGRFDDPATVFAKRMLQTGLPEALRRRIVRELFEEFVTADERGFAETLYCTEEELRDMRRAGMYVGGHGNTHRWLNCLDETEREQEIAATLELLRRLGAPTEDWIMCYPHGGHDARLMSLLREQGCVVGLDVRTGIARLGEHEPLSLPRLDTNHLPRTAGAAPCGRAMAVGA